MYKRQHDCCVSTRAFAQHLLVSSRIPHARLKTSFRPVSYTHLDVYKRQLRKRDEFARREKRFNLIYLPIFFGLLIGNLFLVSVIPENWGGWWSVSYTHLDVYKRQPLKGEMKGRWSITVNGNWRVTFEFKDGNAYLLDYEDYHLSLIHI